MKNLVSLFVFIRINWSIPQNVQIRISRDGFVCGFSFSCFIQNALIGTGSSLFALVYIFDMSLLFSSLSPVFYASSVYTVYHNRQKSSFLTLNIDKPSFWLHSDLLTTDILDVVYPPVLMHPQRFKYTHSSKCTGAHARDRCSIWNDHILTAGGTKSVCSICIFNCFTSHFCFFFFFITFRFHSLSELQCKMEASVEIRKASFCHHCHFLPFFI